MPKLSCALERLRVRSGHGLGIRSAVRSPGLSIVVLAAAFGCRPPTEREVAPEVADATQRRDAVSVYEELEALIAQGRDAERDRVFAHERVREMPDDGSAGYAFARGALAGRVAELRGIKAGRLVGEAEKWARASVERDPTWNDGAAKRMLGTLYVKAPARLVQHGDSEEGLEMLEALVEERPDDPVNHLRLAEAYVHLGDPDPAVEPLCRVLPERARLRHDDQRLLDGLVNELGGPDALECDPGGEA